VRIEEAKKTATDLTGLVRHKRKKAADETTPELLSNGNSNGNGKRKAEDDEDSGSKKVKIDEGTNDESKEAEVEASVEA
jgi:HAT1-interacting factor 1